MKDSKRKESILHVFKIVADLEPLCGVTGYPLGAEEGGDHCRHPCPVLRQPFPLQYPGRRLARINGFFAFRSDNWNLAEIREREGVDWRLLGVKGRGDRLVQLRHPYQGHQRHGWSPQLLRVLFHPRRTPPRTRSLQWGINNTRDLGKPRPNHHASEITPQRESRRENGSRPTSSALRWQKLAGGRGRRRPLAGGRWVATSSPPQPWGRPRPTHTDQMAAGRVISR